MKLYYAPGTCALAPHIALEELGMVYETEQVNLKNKTCSSGDYYQVNPKGSVPALRMESNEILTETAVILQYLGDLIPEKNLLPAAGSVERYRVMELLNHIATDLHKTYNPLFFPARYVRDENAQEQLRGSLKEMLAPRLTGLNAFLAGKNFLMGEQFTVADCYLFTVLSWNRLVGIDTSKWGNLSSYCARIEKRPAVVKAMKAQGLLKN